MTTTARRALVPLVVVAGLLSTSCGGDDDAAAGGSPPSTSDDPATGLPSGRGMTEVESGIADLRFRAEDCPTGRGRHEVRGRVVNSADRTVDYQITLTWTGDDAGAKGSGTATVRDVGPGARAAWRLTARVGAGATQCVPNVLRGTIEQG